MEYFCPKSTGLQKIDKLILGEVFFTEVGYSLKELSIFTYKVIKFHPCEKFLVDAGFVYLVKYFEEHRRITFGYCRVLHHVPPEFKILVSVVIEIYVQSIH